ncbi:HAD-IIIC family phosphatase [Amycolatopsis pithecellobii]|uniref:HAD-IIIC family phosphatase n=1 Tax=Amycolatopsis pithecellobii TaxID=664692 RepID=A0A6N7Z9U6_9PSEU|nr:HAD-IIIC family phosphatase [Amycolatopsis pithecellobii]MTD58507.1 HAD-IIIC family phosphatase [Amycolatopsis pithecellobii]
MTGLTDLFELHHDGALAENYPRLPGLLAELTAEELVRAGHLLSRVDADEVLAAQPDQRAVTTVITGPGTLDGLVAPMTAETARHGLLLRPVLAGFDSYVFVLSGDDPEIARHQPDLVLCVLDPSMITRELAVPWEAEDAERVLAEKLDLLEQLVAGFTARSDATLVLNTFPLPHELSAALVDRRSRARLSIAWHEAEVRLLRLAGEHPSVVVIDLDSLVAEGIPLTEPRMSVYAGAYLSEELLVRYAREAGHVARQITGLTKKCLVLDLDQTLWDGILAEDGPDGIAVGGGGRGDAFQAFQRVVKQIGSRGVLLAAVSKNEAEDVRAAFRAHPGMPLSEDDFVRITANWDPKHQNLTELAEALNIGVDSFVFADDSPYECGLVRRGLPGTAVVGLTEEPAWHPRDLLRDNWFTVTELTGEDRTRGVKYKQEVARKTFLSTFSSIEDYLRELDVTVHLGVATAAQAGRVAQMSLRTNQFNLTTHRLQHQDVTRLLADEDSIVFTIASRDRFGDNGIVGAVFYRRDGELAWIDNFLLSCRVFSRGIEQACLAAVLDHAFATGVHEMRAIYRPSLKNAVVREFYPRYGFTTHDHDDERTVFRHDLALPVEIPKHVRFTGEIERPVR